MKEESDLLNLLDLSAEEEPVRPADKALLVLPDDYYLDDELDLPPERQTVRDVVMM